MNTPIAQSSEFTLVMKEDSRFQVVHRIRGRLDANVALVAEHASNAVPDDYAWFESDKWLVDTHWAWDPGARTIVEELAARLGAPAVLANFSRLLADPNRPEDSPGLIRDTADGRAIQLNAEVSEAERTRRIARFHRPYHVAAGELARAHRGPFLVSIHTFTPIYEGQHREIEVGVLWEKHDELNERLADRFEEYGFRVGRNEPYSGKEGLAYSVERHASANGLVAVELEFRQDLCTDPAFRDRVADAVEGFFTNGTSTAFPR